MILNHIRWLVYCRRDQVHVALNGLSPKELTLSWKNPLVDRNSTVSFFVPSLEINTYSNFRKKNLSRSLIGLIYPRWNANERGPYRRVRSDQSSHIYIVLPLPPGKILNTRLKPYYAWKLPSIYINLYMYLYIYI